MPRSGKMEDEMNDSKSENVYRTLTKSHSHSVNLIKQWWIRRTYEKVVIDYNDLHRKKECFDQLIESFCFYHNKETNDVSFYFKTIEDATVFMIY